MAKAVADDYLRRIPKAELHCHLAGTLRATTVAELAARAGLALPRPADKLYQWPDFYGFLDVLRLTASGAAHARGLLPRRLRILSRTPCATATSGTSSSSSIPTTSIPTASTIRRWSTA